MNYEILTKAHSKTQQEV